MNDPKDGQRIGGMQVLVVPDWLLRAIPGGTAILLPHDVAESLRKQLEQAGVIEPLPICPTEEPSRPPEVMSGRLGGEGEK